MVVTALGTVGRGRGAAVRDGLGVTSLGAGGILASVCCTSMMKRTIGAGGVFLGASGRGVYQLIAVGALGVTGSLRRFLDLERLREEEQGWEENVNIVGVNRDYQRSGLLGEPSSSALVKVPGCANRDLIHVVD